MKKFITCVFGCVPFAKLFCGSKKICCLKPFGSHYNAYFALMKSSLHRLDIEPFSISYSYFADFIWYHFIEKSYTKSRVLARIKQHAAVGKKIIWNLHNKIPHDAKDVAKAKDFMREMAKISNKIVIHCSETTGVVRELCGDNPTMLEKIVLVPHPNYIGIYGAEKADNILQNNKLSLCFFGAVKKYKNLELLINAVNELNFNDVELKIVGRCRSASYARQLKNLIGGNSNIITDFRFVKDNEIPQITANSHLFVLPYNLNSSLNSGATLLAFSYGRSVLSSLTGTLADIERKDIFFAYSYTNESEHKEKLKEQIIAIREKYNGKYNELLKLGEDCKQYMVDNNSIEHVTRQLSEVFNIKFSIND